MLISFCSPSQPTCLSRRRNAGHRHLDLPTGVWTVHGRRGQSSPLLSVLDPSHVHVFVPAGFADSYRTNKCPHTGQVYGDPARDM